MCEPVLKLAVDDSALYEAISTAAELARKLEQIKQLTVDISEMLAQLGTRK